MRRRTIQRTTGSKIDREAAKAAARVPSLGPLSADDEIMLASWPSMAELHDYVRTALTDT